METKELLGRGRFNTSKSFKEGTNGSSERTGKRFTSASSWEMIRLQRSKSAVITELTELLGSVESENLDATV